MPMCLEVQIRSVIIFRRPPFFRDLTNISAHAGIKGREAFYLSSESDDEEGEREEMSSNKCHYETDLNCAIEFPQALRSDRLTISIRDDTSNRIIGQCAVSLKHIRDGQRRDVRLLLATREDSPVVAGEVNVSLFFSQEEADGVISSDSSAFNPCEIYENRKQKLADLLQAYRPSLLTHIDVILNESLAVAQVPSGNSDATCTQSAVDSIQSGDCDDTCLQLMKQHFDEACATIAQENSLLMADPVSVSVGVAQFSPSPRLVEANEHQQTMYAIVVTTDSREACVNTPLKRGTETTPFVLYWPAKAVFRVSVFKKCPAATFEPCVGTATFSLGSLIKGTACERSLPLVDEGGAFAGSVDMNLACETYGLDSVDGLYDESFFRSAYARLTSLLRRYKAVDLGRLDDLVVGHLDHFEAYLGDLVDSYGLEPGTASVTVIIESIAGLCQKVVGSKSVEPISSATLEVFVSVKGLDKPIRGGIVTIKRGRIISGTPLKPVVLELESENDPIEITLYDASTQNLIGTLFVSVASLQRGVAKKRTHALVAEAGKASAFVSGTVMVTLLSSNIGREHAIDETYENSYRARIQRLLGALHPELLHRADVILSTCYDLESFADQLEEEARHEGIRMTGSSQAEQTLVRIALLRVENLPDACRKGYQVLAQAGGGSGTCLGRRGMGGQTATFPANTEVLELSGNTHGDITIHIQSVAALAEIGRVIIPVAALWKNTAQQKWYDVWVDPFTMQSHTCGQVLLSIETRECGTEGGNGDAITMFGEEEPQAAQIHIVENDAAPVCLATGKFDEAGEPIEITLEEELQEPGVQHSFNIEVISITNCVRSSFNQSVIMNAFVELKLRDQATMTRVVKGDVMLVTFNEKTHIGMPNPCLKDFLDIAVFESENEDGAEEDTFIGEARVDITRIIKGKRRDISVPIVFEAGTEVAEVRGFINLSISCASWGRTPPLPLAAMAPVPMNCITRMKDMYSAYCTERLHLIDFDYSAEANFETFMASLVRRYGPEPDGYPLRIDVIGCNNLPPPSVGGPGYAITIKTSRNSRVYSTQGVDSTDPIYNDSFMCSALRKNKDGILVLLRCGKQEYARCIVSQYNLPPNTVRRRTVNLVAGAGTIDARIIGSVTLDMLSEGVGCNSIPSPEEEEDIRERVTNQLRRHRPTDLHKVELMLGEFVGAEDSLITRLIAEFNCLPGDASLAVTVKEVRGLHKGGKTLLRCNPYVKIKTHMEKATTRTLKNVRDGTFDETFAFTMATPEKDYLQVSVYNVVMGDDELHGEALVAINNLQRGVPRTVTVMLVKNPGKKEATFGGCITLVLRSDDFGLTSPIDLAEEAKWRQRFKNFFLKYCPERLHRIHAIAATADYMRRLVKTYGPEPNSDEVSIVICECRDVVDYRGSARVIVACGIDTIMTRSVNAQGNTIYFNEAYTLPVMTGTEDEVAIIVQRQRNAFEYGRAVISLADLVPGVTRDMWVQIVSEHSTNRARVVGSLRIKLSINTSDLTKPRVEKVKPSALKKRLECVLTNTAPFDLHRMDALCTNARGDAIALLQPYLVKDPKAEERIPFTVRVRDLQTRDAGRYSVEVFITHGTEYDAHTVAQDGRRCVLSTNPIRTAPNVVTDLVCRDAVGGGHIDRLDAMQLHFMLLESGVGVSHCRIALKYCEPDFFNLRALSFFTGSGVCIANASIDVRSVGFNCQKRLDVARWATVSRDVVSAISKYDPDCLLDVDALAREATDLNELHKALTDDFASEKEIESVKTIYFNNVQIDITSTELASDLERKGDELSLVIAGKPSQHKDFSTDITKLRYSKTPSQRAHRLVAARGNDDNESDLVPSILSMALSTHATVTTANHDHNNGRVGLSVSAPTTSSKKGRVLKSMRGVIPTLRIDLEDIREAFAAIRLVSRGKNARQPSIADAEISLLPYFSALLRAREQQIIPLVGKGKLVGWLRFDVSFPATQTLSAKIFPHSNKRFVENDEDNIRWYGRIVEYLEKVEQRRLEDIHRQFFERIMWQDAEGEGQEYYEQLMDDIGIEDFEEEEVEEYEEDYHFVEKKEEEEEEEEAPQDATHHGADAEEEPRVEAHEQAIDAEIVERDGVEIESDKTVDECLSSHAGGAVEDADHNQSIEFDEKRELLQSAAEVPSSREEVVPTPNSARNALLVTSKPM